MDRNIDGTVEKGLFDFLCKQAFAADSGQGSVLNSISGRGNHHDLHDKPFMRGHHLVPHQLRLYQRQGRTTRTDFQKAFCHIMHSTYVLSKLFR